MPALPPTHRALRQDVYGQPPTVQEIPTPQPTPGSAVVQVVYAGVVNYTRDLFNGLRHHPYPTPLTLGLMGIGRIAALGEDATTLKIGDLCLLDVVIRGRDDVDRVANATILSAFLEGFTDASRRLMRDVWRDGSYAEYVRMPLENCFKLDEKKLLDGDGGLGYKIEDLMLIGRMLVPYGGLAPDSINIKPGETVIVAPATGAFGSAAVHICLELGAAKVICMGRNGEILAKIKSGAGDKSARVETIPLTGDCETDLKAITAAAGDNNPIDVFFDISPTAAGNSGHIKAGVLSLRSGGRVMLMSGIVEDITLPAMKIMTHDLTIKGKWMYEKRDIKRLINLVETGVIRLNHSGREGGVKPLGTEDIRKYKLEEWKEAFEVAFELGSDAMVMLEP